MAFSVRDGATDQIVRELAKLKGKTISETIREAAENELRREQEKVPLGERLDALTREFAKYPRTGLKADKAWFDEMWGEED